MSDRSPLHNARFAYIPKMPEILGSSLASIEAVPVSVVEPAHDKEALKKIFAHSYGKPAIRFSAGSNPSSNKTMTLGVLLSGGPAPGGHNVIAGLFDGLKKASPNSRLIGFKGGPGGLVDNKYQEIDAALVDSYRNTGGFDMIGSGRTKIESPEQFAKALSVAREHSLDALVVVGGDDSNTNAAVLAEFFATSGEGICVVGCPKTIDGDLKNKQIEVSFGFDTATKVYAELTGNVERDCLSAKKYWHFIKVMGRSASHIALEVALKCQPNVCLVSEEVAENKWTLAEVTETIARVVDDRSAQKKNYGVVVVPEGLLEFIPEMKKLIGTLNDTLAENTEFERLETAGAKIEFVRSRLKGDDLKAFDSLPPSIQGQLLADRDPHGNVQVSKIETEKLLMEAVDILLKKWKKEGRYNGKFSAQNHFFGYEGRCAAPSNFDADYCYALGFNAAHLLAAGATGYLSSVRDLLKPAAKWRAGGVPLTSMMNMERRHGKEKPVILKALVDLKGKPFKTFASQRAVWAKDDCYTSPGPIQYWGPTTVADIVPETLRLERK